MLSKKSTAAWRTIGGKRIYFRSQWEMNYARYLEFLKQKGLIIEWEHEPHTFWFEEIKRGVRSYMPDFKVYDPDGSHYWVEVKGWMDPKSVTKIKRLKKYYPNERLEVVGKKWFADNLRIFTKIFNPLVSNVDLPTRQSISRSL